MLLEILSVMGGAGLALAIVTFLSRQLVLHRLSKDLETYRSNLEAERDRQIEKLKHGFEKLALEHQVSFQQVYSQRHDALKKLHQNLRKCLDECLMAVTVNGEQSAETALISLTALQEEVAACEIYLPRDLCNRWLSLLTKMRSALFSLRGAQDAQTQSWEGGRQELIGAVDAHVDAWRALNEQLVDDIREILGVKSRTATTSS